MLAPDARNTQGTGLDCYIPEIIPAFPDGLGTE